MTALNIWHSLGAQHPVATLLDTKLNHRARVAFVIYTHA